MAWSLIAHYQANLGANGGTTGAIDTTGADFLVVIVHSYSDSFPGVSDSNSNSWTPRTKYQSTTYQGVQISYCRGGTVGSGHTFTVAGTGTYPTVSVLAWSGSAATPYDQENGNPGAAGAQTIAAGSVTPSEDNELVIAGLATLSAVTSPGIAGYTIEDSQVATPVTGVSAYQIQTTKTATNPTFTWTTASNCSAVVATFKMAAATGPAEGTPQTRRPLAYSQRV